MLCYGSQKPCGVIHVMIVGISGAMAAAITADAVAMSLPRGFIRVAIIVIAPEHETTAMYSRVTSSGQKTYVTSTIKGNSGGIHRFARTRIDFFIWFVSVVVKPEGLLFLSPDRRVDKLLDIFLSAVSQGFSGASAGGLGGSCWRAIARSASSLVTSMNRASALTSSGVGSGHFWRGGFSFSGLAVAVGFHSGASALPCAAESSA